MPMSTNVQDSKWWWQGRDKGRMVLLGHDDLDSAENQRRREDANEKTLE